MAGIVSLTASTPNSHVAILSKTVGVPFVYLALAEDTDRARQLVGHRVALRVYDQFTNDIRLIDTEGQLTDQQVKEILALKAPAKLDYQPMARRGAYSHSADGLLPADIRYFGGKAANFGILRTSIPNDSPFAVAFSFDLWNDFLDQNLTSGSTLRQAIHNRLDRYAYPPDIKALSADLAAIQAMFTDTGVTSFSVTLQNAVHDTLTNPAYGFDSRKNLRFRSSTNMEDAAKFTGAGLYDSYSGCLADELDGDTNGPCLCDASEAKERGVFRAIRKVYASFYNLNAFLERLRHKVNEDEVGMGLLVHPSFPDIYEMANGVATVENLAYLNAREFDLVTQKGANSVTNPEGGAIPEEVTAYIFKSGDISNPTLVHSSNLVVIGDTVMTWDSDYRHLISLLDVVARRFEEVTSKTVYVLDFEYKKVAPDGHLEIKQVRQLPQPDTTQNVVPFLINEPTQYCTYQGEYWMIGDVFAIHRSKLILVLQNRSRWLSEANLKQSIYGNAVLEFAADGAIRSVSGNLPSWPEATHSLFYDAANHNYDAFDSWVFYSLRNPRCFTLSANDFNPLVAPAQSPLWVLPDFSTMQLRVDYADPVMTINPMNPTTTTLVTTDYVQIWPWQPARKTDILKDLTFTGPNGVSIQTSFYWPAPPQFSRRLHGAPAALCQDRHHRPDQPAH